ncbi:MAG: TonB-dependent receptor [Williamsia sp.]|nr:TonB-dependent receptor [Williamsia sp.]
MILVALAGFGQAPDDRITGSVQDTGHHALEGVTVSLLHAKDSSRVAHTVSDAKGQYAFRQSSPGNYLLLFSSVGYTSLYSEKFQLDANRPVKILPSVQLHQAATNLAGVTVAGRKSLIEQKIDRTVVNVDAAVTNGGATALEVLEKLPGVTVDKDGNVSMKGKASVMIMVDGKPSYLSGAELVNLLRTLNANQLDQIELMTNPPAKYDAAGNSGIINIKTKKIKLQGFNGSATAGYAQGIYARTNNSLNLNYRTANVNTFANFSFNESKRGNELDIERKYKHADGHTINAMFDQTSYIKQGGSDGSVKAGMDFFLSKKTTLGFVGTGYLSSQRTEVNNTSFLKNSVGETDSVVHSAGNGKEPWRNGTFNLNFRQQFDTTGRELTADIDYMHYRADGDQHFTNTSYKTAGVKMNETSLRADLPIGINIYSAKIDYTQLLKGAIKFETGVKSSYVKTSNQAGYYNLLGGQWQPDYEKTNSFRYTENINAAYINLNKQIRKWGIQTGLRYENTNYSGLQAGNPQKRDSSFRRSYNSFFPTLFFSYAANPKNQFGLNIGRRIDRPAYQDLNPFIFFLDNYTYQSGNPYLKPQFSTNIELSHTFHGFLTTTLNYSRTRNYFMQTFEQAGYATVLRNDNIGLRRNGGVAVSAQVPVKKWWNASVYANYNYDLFTGVLYGDKLKAAAGTFMTNINNQFRFEHGWSAELSGFYRTRGVEGQIMIQPLGQVSAGVSKQVLKSKGSLRFSIRDLFYTQKSEGRMNFQQTEAHFRDRPDSRVANITFSYRFGKPLKTAQNNRKTGGSDEEQNRVRVGGN